MTDDFQPVQILLRSKRFRSRFYGDTRRVLVTRVIVYDTTVVLQGWGLSWHIFTRLETRPQTDNNVWNDFRGLTQEHWEMIRATRQGQADVDELFLVQHPILGQLLLDHRNNAAK
ncbi:MAG: hypothetical protein JWN82_11 [Candidatus Saccharibacteria bacterium]|nr:hypothetical protein [Candidatus Saccharibacteria bacterium]